MHRKCKSFRHVFCFLCCLFMIICFNSIASNKNIKVYLPKKLEISIPNSWKMLSDDRKQIIDLSTHSVLNLSARKSDLGFAANCYNKAGITISILNVQYNPDYPVSYSEACKYNDDGIQALNALAEIGATMLAENSGLEIVSWVGTKKVDIDGLVAFVTEYRRKSQDGTGVFRVRLVKIFAGLSRILCF